MKTKLLPPVGLIGLALAVFLTVVMGGWSVLVLVILAGAMIGFSAREAGHNVGWALVAGAVAGGIMAAAAWFHNSILQQLPNQETVPAEAQSILVYAGTVLLGALVAGLVAFLNGHANDKVRNWGLMGLLLLLAVTFPFYEQGTRLFWMSTIIVSLFFILQALGLNIVAGYAGMLDLGYVAFFAIGGYTAALLMSPHITTLFAMKWSFWLVIFIAAAAAALFGLILGAPVIPLRGDYLAIVTLGFGEIVPIVFKNLEAVTIYEPITRIIGAITGNSSLALCILGCPTPLNLTNGTQGVNPISRPVIDLTGIGIPVNYTFKTGEYIPWYFLILTIVVLAAFFISRLRRSRMGRAWVSMRDNELAANAMGVPLVRTKLIAFMIGAMFSGFAGAFYASYVSFISPDAFDFSISVIVLCMVILGGSASIPGVILGGFVIKLVDLLILDKLQILIGGLLQATVLKTVPEGFAQFLGSLLDVTQYKLLLFGVILVFMMLTRPQGLIPARVVKYDGKTKA